MNSLLIRSLTKLSSKVIDSKTTHSQYFHIGNIIVRVSDHMTDNDSYDLAIIKNIKGYTLIPKSGKYRKIEVLKNVDSVLKYITHFNYFHNVFLGRDVTPVVEDLAIGIAKEKQEFLDSTYVKGWVCSNAQPDNIKYLLKLYDYHIKKNSLKQFMDALRMYSGLKAELKHDYLIKACLKYGI